MQLQQQSPVIERNGVIQCLRIWQEDPENYFRTRLGITQFWGGQLAFLRCVTVAIKERKKLVVASGNALGKDFICGGLVPYFLEAWGPCIVITTAPTSRQVESVMWGEIKNRYAHAPAPLPGRLLTTRIDIEPDWYAMGFTTTDAQGQGKFQGFHSPRVFVIASEAQAIEDNIYEQIDAILTGDIGLLIEIGNPLRASGQYARDIKAVKDNIVLRLSCLDTPNYKEQRQVIPGICSHTWVEDKRKRWGEDDPRWQARVLGQIPTSSIDTIFSQKLIDKILNATTRQTQVRRGVAVDVGRFGTDETVIYGGTNGIIEASDIYTGLSTTETAARSIKVHNKIERGNFIIVDGDGVGGGTIDTLNDMEIRGLDIVEIHSAGKPRDEQYVNLRAEMWFTAKRAAEEGRASIPNDTILIEELLEVRWFVNKHGKIQIEAKEDIVDRLGRSPNRADAWVYYQYGMSIAEPVKHGDRWAEDDCVASGHSGVTSSIKGMGGMAG